MRMLLDAHTLIWAVDQPAKLGPRAAAALPDPANELVLSAATLWEIAVKVGLGKLTLSFPYKQWMNKSIADLSLTVLPITIEYADAQITLPRHHGDPFDRLIIAQALTEAMPIVSADPMFEAYGATRLW